MHFPNSSTGPSWKPTALVIDKDADIHRSLHVMLGNEYDVHHAYFPRLAVSLLEKQSFNVVFTSIDMANADEMPELQKTIESIARRNGISVIPMAGDQTSFSGWTGSVKKPLDVDNLLAALREARSGQQA